MKAVITSNKDYASRIKPSSDGGCEDSNVSDTITPNKLLSDLQNRCHAVVEIIHKLVISSTGTTKKYASNLFHLLLLTYLSTTSSLRTSSLLPTLLTSENGMVASMALLPMLCDKWDVGSLLSNADNILQMMKWIFTAAVSAPQSSVPNTNTNAV